MVAITPRGREVRNRIDQLMLRRTSSILATVPAGFRPQLLAGLRLLNQALGPDGCCEFSGEWPDVAVSCSAMNKKTESDPRRKRNARR